MTQKFLYVYRADGLNHHLAIIQHTSHLYTFIMFHLSFYSLWHFQIMLSKPFCGKHARDVLFLFKFPMMSIYKMVV